MEHISVNPKYSKWSIVAFIYFIINIIAVFFFPLSYSSSLTLIQIVVLTPIELGVLWLIVRHVKTHNLKGLLLSKISFYGVLFINIIAIALTLVLIKPHKEVQNFALTETKTFIKEDLSTLKGLSTQDMVDMLSYEDNISNFKDAIRYAGPIERCKFTEEGYATTTIGFYRTYPSYTWGIQGGYMVRCFGGKSYIDIFALLRKIDSRWIISSLWYLSPMPSKELLNETQEGKK